MTQILDTNRSIPTHDNIATSKESKDMLVTKTHRYRSQIYDYFVCSKGATCDEVEQGLGLRHQTASCFIRFLTQDGFLRDSGMKRITRAWRMAIVWTAVLQHDQQLRYFEG